MRRVAGYFSDITLRVHHYEPHLWHDTAKVDLLADTNSARAGTAKWHQHRNNN